MIRFVGAGPGAADLITLRGARLLGEADLVVYAGSLINPELLELCRTEAELVDSSGLVLDEIVGLLVEADRVGRSCVRLHTGDPALYGAIAEQMRELDRHGIAYEVVPGVSSLFGASAALGLEYTAPGVSQSLIVTRMAGRTPMPERERLREMASHGCTMALFLSAGLLREASLELVADGYAPDTPAAIVQRATWPDEAVYRCTVGTLAACAERHGVDRQAIAIVGDVLSGAGAPSLLYDPAFSHGYRPAAAEAHAGASAAQDAVSVAPAREAPAAQAPTAQASASQVSTARAPIGQAQACQAPATRVSAGQAPVTRVTAGQARVGDGAAARDASDQPSAAPDADARGAAPSAEGGAAPCA